MLNTLDFLGNDYVDRNAERTFITRTDCYGLCQDPTLIAAVKSDDPAVCQ